MSEKTRKKKDGADQNKDSQRMKETEKDSDKKNAASKRQNKTGSGAGK